MTWRADGSVAPQPRRARAAQVDDAGNVIGHAWQARDWRPGTNLADRHDVEAEQLSGHLESDQFAMHDRLSSFNG